MLEADPLFWDHAGVDSGNLVWSRDGVKTLETSECPTVELWLIHRNPARVEECIRSLIDFLLCHQESIVEANHEVRIGPLDARKGSVYLCDLSDRNNTEWRKHTICFKVVFGTVAHDDGSDEDLCECRICDRQYSRHKLFGRGDNHRAEKKEWKIFGGIV